MSARRPTRKTVERWISSFPELTFNGSDLICNICDSVLAWHVKTAVLQHVATDKHKARQSGTMTARDRQKQFNLDLVHMMVACNIPFAKLDHPEFRQFVQNAVNGKYGDVNVPAATTLRQLYVTPLCEDIKKNIVAELHGKPIWVSIDKTEVVKGQTVANVVVGGLDEAKAMEGHLIASRVLVSTSALTISQCVTSSLQTLWGEENFQENASRVLLLVTDGATDMKATGQWLKRTYTNLIHVTCLAHGLHEIAKTVRECYPNVDSLIANVPQVFVKAPSRRKQFSEALPRTPLPPEPVENRWGTWVKAATYYYINYDDVKRVINEFDGKEADSVLKAQQAYSDPNLRSDLAYIHGQFSKIPVAIKTLEKQTTSEEYTIVNALNSIFDLRQQIFQLTGPVAERVQQTFKTVLETNPDFPALCSIVDLLRGNEVNASEQSTDLKPLQNFRCFKYAPVTSVAVERSLTSYKSILTDKRQNFTPEHMEQLMIIHQL